MRRALGGNVGLMYGPVWGKNESMQPVIVSKWTQLPHADIIELRLGQVCLKVCSRSYAYGVQAFRSPLYPYRENVWTHSKAR